jgi:hypothetical protein
VITTFTDGTFYAIGVRPGTWEMQVDPGCLATLRATSDPIRFSLAPSVDGVTVSGLDVVIR